MSISDNYSPDKSLGDGATTEFSGNWKVLNSSYFRLHLENATTGAQTLQTLGVDYTLTFDATGYVATMTTAPTSDNFVVRSRVVDIDQTDPYKTSKGFQGKTLEDSLDKLTAIDQDQNDGISRSLKFPIGSTGIVDGGLPTPVDNSLLSWDGVTGLVKNVTPASVDSSIDTLFSSLTSGDVIQYNGTVFVNKAQLALNKGADVASATALTLGTDGNYFDVTGTTTITSIGTIGVGTVIKLHFDGALTLTHHATDLILPGAANITTAAGDEAEFVEYASGDWRCTNYQVAASAPGGGSGWVALETITASNDASIDFVDGIDGTYKAYVIVFSQLVPANDGTGLIVRTGNGGSFDSGAGNYSYAGAVVDDNDTAWTIIKSASATSVVTTSAVGNASPEGISGVVQIHNPANASAYTIFNFTTCALGQSTEIINSQGAGARLETAAHDRFQLLFGGGNVVSGEATLYGLVGA